MKLCRKTIVVSLSSILFLSASLPALSQTMLIPRLGYPTVGSKRVYLDITTKDLEEQKEKELKEQQKASQKQSKEAEKALKAQEKAQKKEKAQTPENGSEQQALEDSTTADTASKATLEATQPEKTVSSDVVTDNEADTKADKKAEKEAKKKAKDEEAKVTEEQKQTLKDEARRKHDQELIAKARKMMETREAKFQKVPVEGMYYLFNLKQDRLVFKEPSKLQSATPENPVAPYYVEFKEAPREGVYDLAVRGSGHRSKTPLWISDYVYWDALQPVVKDISKAHCPRVAGKYLILQQCSLLNVSDKSGNSLQQPTIIKGGWYTDTDDASGMIKSTPEIAKLSQLLLDLYQINPKSYKYLLLPGENYAISKYPDLLDEANWGLQYLLTVQQANGGFPGGIRKSTEGERQGYYWLMPETSESTALGVMTLATATKVFRPEELSIAVKYMRAAENGWDYLKAHADSTSPEALLLASGALMQVSDNPEYQKAFNDAKASVKSISPETALFLGVAAEGIPVQEGSTSGKIISQLPAILQLKQNTAGVYEQVSQWVTDLFGYEAVPLVRDANLQVVSALVDPLQWAATKTGEVATRVGYKLSDDGVLPSNTKIDSEKLKDLEAKELEARKRVQAGYDKLALSSMDKAYLAYTLALLNEHASPTVDPETKKEPERNWRHEEPTGSIKGFWRKPI